MTETNGNSKNHFEMSIDTRLLYDMLAKTEIEATVSYESMTANIGRRVDGSCPNLQSAIRRALHEDDMVFMCLRGQGYKRISDHEIVAGGHSAMKAHRRKARRDAKRMSCVADFNALTPDEKIKHNVYLSVFSTLANMTKESGLRKVEDAVTRLGQQLPMAKTLEAFK